MPTTRLSGTQAVNSYFDSLLIDVSEHKEPIEKAKPSVRFANVQSGYEVRVLWDGPLNQAQKLCAKFTLLSCLQKISGYKLRRSILHAISLNGC